MLGCLCPRCPIPRSLSVQTCVPSCTCEKHWKLIRHGARISFSKNSPPFGPKHHVLERGLPQAACGDAGLHHHRRGLYWSMETSDSNSSHNTRSQDTGLGWQNRLPFPWEATRTPGVPGLFKRAGRREESIGFKPVWRGVVQVSMRVPQTREQDTQLYRLHPTWPAPRVGDASSLPSQIHNVTCTRRQWGCGGAWANGLQATV